MLSHVARTAVLAGLAVLFVSGRADAQVRWDASAQVGIAKRFLTSALDQPSFGPAATIAAHVALVPLVRLGAYVEHDVSPIESSPARRFYAGGLRAKVQAPWSTARVHGWGFVGAGYVGVYGPHTISIVETPAVGPLSVGSGPLVLSANGAGGGFFEIPVGVGLGVRLRRPWELVFELTGRVGLGFSGSLYEGRTAASAAGPQTLAPVGNDTFALVLSGGIGLDL